jgi:hypothetical protein
MNDQIKNLLTHVLTGAGMFLVGKGWVTAETMTQVIIPGVLSVAGLAWAAWMNTRAAKVASVAATPGTEVVLPRAERALAETMPDNVTSK